MAIRPLVRGDFTSGSLPARLLRYNGKVVGKMEDTSVIPLGASYSGCNNKRRCLDNCNYSLTTRNIRHDYVQLTVSGIADRTCTGSRVRASDGWTINETLELTGFAVMNGTYVAPIEDYPWSWSAPTSPCGVRIKPTQWAFTNYQRSYGNLVSTTGASFPFDVTCQMQTTITLDCFNLGFGSTYYCDGAWLSILTQKISPAAIPFTNFKLYEGYYYNYFPCIQAGNDETGLVPVDGHWWGFSPGFCRAYSECNGESSSAVWTNSVNYGMTVCCPFSSMSVTDSWT